MLPLPGLSLDVLPPVAETDAERLSRQNSRTSFGSATGFDGFDDTEDADGFDV